MTCAALAYGMTDDRVGYHLHLWTVWMHTRGRELDYPSESCLGLLKGYASANVDDFDSACAQVDIACAEAVDAVVDGLPQSQRLAVHHKHLGAVYRIRSDIGEAYQDARDTIGRELTKRGIE